MGLLHEREITLFVVLDQSTIVVLRDVSSLISKFV